MLDKLLGRSKPKAKAHDPLGGFQVDESIDLENGTIYIDDRIPEDRIVAASEVFEDTATTDERITQANISGGGGKVFALDLRPFFRAVGTAPGERSADTFTRFCENWLSRAVGKTGAYEFDGLEFFFFKLDLPNDQAVVKAIEIINEIGLQYLRGAFNPDLVAQVLAPLEADKATDPATGKISRKMAFDALAGWKALHGRETLTTEQIVQYATTERDERQVLMVEIEAHDRPAATRVQRGPDRRQRMRKIVSGKDRRTRKRGRRASDDPRNGAAWK